MSARTLIENERYHSGGTRAEQLRTGAVASDRHQFDVAWKGSWYRLGSLSDHVREKVDPTRSLLRALLDLRGSQDSRPQERGGNSGPAGEPIVSTARNAFAEAVAQSGAKVRSVLINDTMHLLIAPPDSPEAKQFEAKVQAALKRGDTIVEGNTSRWIECVPLYDGTKQGSAVYTWHKDGNRIKNRRVLFTKVRGQDPKRAIVTETPLGMVWRSYLAE